MDGLWHRRAGEGVGRAGRGPDIPHGRAPQWVSHQTCLRERKGTWRGGSITRMGGAGSSGKSSSLTTPPSSTSPPPPTTRSPGAPPPLECGGGQG
eukprot:1977997-Rhodomonas_salina.2